MTIDNVRFLPLPNSNLNEIQIVAKDTKSGRIVGSLKACVCNNKAYSGEKIPSGYINRELSTDYRKIAKSHIYVEDLFVAKDKRHQNLGTNLIKNIVEQSIKRGYKGRVLLLAGNVKEDSPLPFYAKLGFVSGNKEVNNLIKNTIATNSKMNNYIQTYMALPANAVTKLMKVI